MSGPNEEGGQRAAMEVTPTTTAPSSTPATQSRAGGNSASSAAAAARRVNRNRSGPTTRGVSRNRSVPLRGVARNKSGPMRGVARNKSGPRRGVNRTTSRNRALPLKTNSFHRSVPDRASSTSSLRKYRRQQNAASSTSSRLSDDSDISIASTQTNDSIAVRKSQISGISMVAEGRGRREDDSVASSSIDLDGSLHTVDSMAFHHRHIEEGGPPDDMSAFSESFVSTATFMEDYGDDDLGGDIPESDQKIDIEMKDLKIAGGKRNEMVDDDDDDFEEEEDLK